MKGIRGLLLILSMVAPGLGSVAAASPANASPQADMTACAPRTNPDLSNPEDVNGDANATAELVTGVPWPGSGALDVRYDGGASRIRVAEGDLKGVTPGRADRFGAAVTYANLNFDSCADLVVGAPGADNGRGAVFVLFGQNAGIDTHHPLTMSGRYEGEHFGSAVSVAKARSNSGTQIDVNLLVGAPDRTVSGRSRAGAVDRLAINSGSLSRVQSISQSTPGVGGVAEVGDRFGSVLLGNSVGDPDEDFYAAIDAGTVTVLGGALSYGDEPTRVISRDTAGIPGVPEAGDRFGAALAGDYAGAPGTRVGTADGAGAVFNLVPSPYRLSVITQNTPGVPGVAEPGDHYGAAIAFGSVLACGGLDDEGSYGLNDVIVGAPGEDIGTIRDAGMVTLVDPLRQRTDYGNRACAGGLYQGHGAIGGASEAGDNFGARLFTVEGGQEPGPITYFYRPDDLAVGVTGEDIGTIADAGAVVLAKSNWDGPVTSSVALWNSTGPLHGQRYGRALPH